MQQRDSLGYTLGVAAVLCVVCSLAVSAAAVILKPYQDANELLDQQKNILDVTGLAMSEFGRPAEALSKAQIDQLYGRISEELVNLDTGDYNTELNKETYDPREAVMKEQSRGGDRRSTVRHRRAVSRKGRQGLFRDRRQ